MSQTDIVVTGLGATTPLGGTVAPTWAALLDGQSGIREINEPWADELPVRIAGLLTDDPAASLERVKVRRLDRSQQAALVAAREAWADAGTPSVDGDRLAVVIGTGIGGAVTMLNADDLLESSSWRRLSPFTIPMLMANGPAASVGLELGARAGVHTTVSACASGAEAIALGRDLIAAGRADVVVAGGTEAVIHPLPFAAFAAMRALSTRNEPTASRPFDRSRDGFVMGEGAGVVILERAADAAARGARVYARLAGTGVTSDAYDMVQPDPVGSGAGRAIGLALAQAGLTGTDVQHVNAHATSTPVGDVAEAAALRAAVGSHALVSAPKGALGHLLGAAGAVEAVLTVLSVYHQIVPPTINLSDIDDGVELEIATKPTPLAIEAALSDSFGFGGHNAALLFTR